MAKLFDIFQKRKEILEGVMNTLFTSKHVEEIAAKRMEVCNSCPHMDKEGSSCFVPGTAPCCSKCGCRLQYMVRSLSSACSDPENPRWEAILSPDEEADVNRQLDYDPDKPTQKSTQDNDDTILQGKGS